VRIPGGLSDAEQLTYIIGAIAGAEVGLMQANESLYFTLVGPTSSAMYIRPNLHGALIDRNRTMVSRTNLLGGDVREDGLKVLDEAKEAISQRNEVVHATWIVDEKPGVYYRVNAKTPPAWDVTRFRGVYDRLRRAAIRILALAHVLAFDPSFQLQPMDQLLAQLRDDFVLNENGSWMVSPPTGGGANRG
jgi:hypothetical protein